MKNQDIWKQLFTFLKQNNAYTEYRKVVHRSALSVEDKLNNYISKKISLGQQITIANLIDNSFFWGGTSQGYDFWDTLYENGRKLIVKK